MENEEELCVYCHYPENHASHRGGIGWHPFRGKMYLESIEDALLFAREKNQPHQWLSTGWVIDTFPSYPDTFPSTLNRMMVGSTPIDATNLGKSMKSGP